MKIAVCIKQVPETSDGTMDEKTGLMIRSGLSKVTNPYDMAAIEAALRIKEKVGEAEIYAFSMGNAEARSSLTYAYSMGVDRAYLIFDKAFAGSDVLATSYTLTQAIGTVGKFDLIICGRQTTDGDTAQVSGALAKWFEITHFNWVYEIKEADETKITLSYMTDDETISVRVVYPLVISVEREAFLPHIPSLRDKINGKKKTVEEIGLESMEDKDCSHYGILGSATKVKKIFPPKKEEKHEVIFANEMNDFKYISKIIKDKAFNI